MLSVIFWACISVRKSQQMGKKHKFDILAFILFIQLPCRRMVRQASSGVPPARLWSCAAGIWHWYPGDESSFPLSLCHWLCHYISSSCLQPRCGTVWRSTKWSWIPTAAMEKWVGWCSQVKICLKKPNDNFFILYASEFSWSLDVKVVPPIGWNSRISATSLAAWGQAFVANVRQTLQSVRLKPLPHFLGMRLSNFVKKWKLISLPWGPMWVFF